MALTTATITFDISDHLGVDFDTKRAKVWVTTNVPSSTIVDTSGNKIRLGTGSATLNADGTGTLTVWVPGAGSNPASWQTTIHVDVPDRNAPGGRGLHAYGPFTITASADLADLIEEQAVSPEYAGQLVAQMEAIRDDTVAISGISTSDGVVEALVKNTGGVGPLTSAALSAAITTDSAGGARVVGKDAPLWQPPTQPAMTSVSNKTAAQMLADWWEPLRDDDYVTRSVIGTDFSGAHSLYRYNFTPPTYDRTILVLCNMHGGEKIGAFNAAKLMEHVANEWRTDAWLAWLRWNVRIVVVPSVNPWGGTSATGERINANGVDINRNWDYKWADYVVPSPPYEKGATAFSEPETVAVRDLALDLDAEGGFVGVVDCHDTGESVAGSPANYYAYLPDHPNTRAGFVRKTFEALYQPGETHLIHPTPDPMSLNWFAAQGWRATAIEYEQDGTALDSANTTAALRWYGNVIMQAAADPADVARSQPEPFVAEMNFSQATTSIQFASAGSFVELSTLTAEFVCNGPGIAIFEGEMTVGTAVANTIELRAAISQAKGRKPTLVSSSLNERRTDTATTASRPIIPFRVAMEVHEDPTTAATWPVKVGLYGKSSAAGVYVVRYVGTFTFLPAEKTNRYRQMSATGGTGAGAMQQTYPV